MDLVIRDNMYDPNTLEWLAVRISELVQNGRYSMVAATVVIYYEWICNFPDEIKLVHSQRWTSVKVAYLLCRYYPLLYFPVILWAYCGDFHYPFCESVIRPIHAFMAPCHFLGQAVMAMRAYAFSGRERNVLIILSLIFFTLIGGDVYLFWVDIPIPAKGAFGPEPPNGRGCLPDFAAELFGLRIQIAFTASIVLDFISLLIVLWYCFKRTGWTPLASYFVKQGMAAFLLIAFTNIAAMILYFQSHATNTGFGLPFVLMMSNVLACRLILSLRLRDRETHGSQMSRDYSVLIHAAFAQQQSGDMWTNHDYLGPAPQEIELSRDSLHDSLRGQQSS